MKNMSLEKERIHVDFSAAGIPESVRNFRPDVYRDGDRYCCLLGNDSDGVFGCGSTLEEAMQKWDEAYWIKRPARKD